MATFPYLESEYSPCPSVTMYETLCMNVGAHWARAPVLKATVVNPIVEKTKVKLQGDKRTDTQTHGHMDIHVHVHVVSLSLYVNIIIKMSSLL